MQSVKFHYDIVYWKEPYDLGHITIYQIGDLCCNPDYEVPIHEQKCYEISYIASGKGTFYVNDMEFAVEENMVFLTRPGQCHRIESSHEDPLRYVYLGFWFKENHPDYAFYRDIKEFFDATETWMVKDSKSIYQFYFDAFSEIITLDGMMHEMLKTYISQIIITSYRMLKNEKSYKQRSGYKGVSEGEIVYNIINYIESENCSINNLANIGVVLGYSYPYLSHLFSNKMGYSIQHHFRKVQFTRAIAQMKQDKKINEIAANLGYSTVYAFSRAFSAQYGMSPTQYKAQLTSDNDQKIAL